MRRRTQTKSYLGANDLGTFVGLLLALRINIHKHAKRSIYGAQKIQKINSMITMIFNFEVYFHGTGAYIDLGQLFWDVNHHDFEVNDGMA